MKRKKKGKLIALLLALALVVSALPSGIMTLAAETDGEISQEEEISVEAEEETDDLVSEEAAESEEEESEAEAEEEVVSEEVDGESEEESAEEIKENLAESEDGSEDAKNSVEPVVLESTVNGVTVCVSGNSDTLSGVVSVSVSELSKERVEAYEEAFAEDDSITVREVIAAYDITLLDEDGNAVEPDGTVSVSIMSDTLERYAEEDIQIIHNTNTTVEAVNDDNIDNEEVSVGALEVVDIESDQAGTFEFTTNSFSEYLLTSSGDIIADGSCGAEGNEDNVTWKLTDNGDSTYTLTISGSGAMADYTSATAENASVSPWAGYNDNITAIVIESGVTYIGVRSFDGCGTSSVSIPDTVTSMGNRAFHKCANLTTVELPDSITEIAEAVFYQCTALESINLENITAIVKNAFDGCSSLKSVDLSSLASMGNYAFQDCSSLTTVTLGNSITALPSGAFKNCTLLSDINFPDSLTTIAGYCSYGTALTDIDLNNVATISSTYVFANCTSLTSISMDNLTGTLPGNTFNGCSSLTSIVIPVGVTTIIASNVFKGCTSLISVTFEGGENAENITLQQVAFTGLSALETLTIDRNITNN